MKSIARLWPLCLLLCAAAGDAPPVRPTVAAEVTYKTIRGISETGPKKLVLRWSKEWTRVDAYIFEDGKWPFESRIHNSSDQSLKILVYRQQTVVLTSENDLQIPALTAPAGSSFAKGESIKVLGRDCTQWTVTPPTAADAFTACIDAEGLVLRTTSEKRELEAVAVKVGPLPDSAFEVPLDLKPMAVKKEGK